MRGSGWPRGVRENDRRRGGSGRAGAGSLVAGRPVAGGVERPGPAAGAGRIGPERRLGPGDGAVRAAGPTLARRAGRPCVPRPTRTAGLPGHGRAARAVGDAALHTAEPLVLPTRRDDDRPVDRRGRARAPLGAGQPRGHGPERARLRGHAADRRRRARPGLVVRDRHPAPDVDTHRDRGVARPRPGLLDGATAPARAPRGQPGTRATRQSRGDPAPLVRPESDPAGRLTGLHPHRDRDRRPRADRRAGLQRPATFLRRDLAARTRWRPAPAGRPRLP
jgi:hypothetical protein